MVRSVGRTRPGAATCLTALLAWTALGGAAWAENEASIPISGVIVDERDLPAPGVTVRLRGTSLIAISDAEGRFAFDAVPAENAAREVEVAMGAGIGGALLAQTGLRVRLSPSPIKLQYGSSARVTASGFPSVGTTYPQWSIKGQNFDAVVAFSDQPNCPDQSSCTNFVFAKELRLDLLTSQMTAQQACGTAQAEVAFEAADTGQRVTDTVALELGCSGKTAAECTSQCSLEVAQGMCGTPCDLTGDPHPSFDDVTGNCWRATINGTDYCYWDHKLPSGPGFVNLCCPNRCFGGSFTVWGQGTGNFVCTVMEPCSADPDYAEENGGAGCTLVN